MESPVIKTSISSSPSISANAIEELETPINGVSFCSVKVCPYRNASGKKVIEVNSIFFIISYLIFSVILLFRAFSFSPLI